MHKSVVYILVCLLLTGIIPELLAQNLVKPANNNQGSSQRIILQGGVEKNVPRTPSEITAYLVEMKKIMKEYEVLSNQLVMILMSGSNTPQAASKARNEWIRLANKIDKIVPPAELNDSHSRLASSLRNSSKFVSLVGDAKAEQKNQVLMGLMPVVSDLSQSALYYNQGVNTVISQHGLDPSLSPLGPQGEISGAGIMNGLDSMGALGAIMGGGSGSVDMSQLQNLQQLQQLNKINK